MPTYFTQVCRATTKHRRGFSLLELVIVIVIIALIAGIAVPRISSSFAYSTESALRADLAAMRKAIDTYAAEHNGVFPGANPDGSSGGANSGEAFSSQLTLYSNELGVVAKNPDPLYLFGPYLRDIPSLPVGANKGSTEVAMDKTSSPPVVTTGTEGWVCNPFTGEIIANSDDPNHDKTRAYDEY